ncbi:sensor histidine kinase [Endothiovibrio diazotrophicus]
MKRPLSLKWFLALAFLSLAAVLVVGYSVLSVHFFYRGMDSFVAAEMERAMGEFLDATPVAQRPEGGEYRGYRYAHRWEAMPAEIRAVYDAPPAQPGTLYVRDPSGWFEHPNRIYFAMRIHRHGETLFAVETKSAESAPRIIRHNLHQSRRLLLAAGAAIVLLFALVIWRLERRVARPVAELRAWTRDLDGERLKAPPPDFAYPELNELAALIRDSLSSLQQGLEREQRFLRHTSHELRTPISVIRNNVELIGRLGEEGDPRRAAAIERIDRASLTMQSLTETLLWLSREGEAPPARRPVALDGLLRRQVEELRYLLEGKAVELEVESEPYRAELPETAARIVLGNLVRNAFQHTWEGEVAIRQRGAEVVIINHGENGEESDLGFGLGLRLTAQLTERLGWPYRNEREPHGHRVTVTFTDPDRMRSAAG